MKQRTKMSLVPTCGLFALVLGGCASAVVRAEGGKSDVVIVQSAQPTEAEAFAAQELADFVRRSTGAAPPIVKEIDFAGGKAMYVGQTEFAASQKIDFGKLGAEEWVIRSAKGSLILCGGRPRGTLYAVYEFLEKCMGVRFLDAYTEHVPSMTRWVLPAGLAIQGSPAFSRREICMVVGGSGSQEFLRFQVRRKINGFANAFWSAGAKYGYSMRFGSPYSTHTHSLYTKDLPEARPEYYAMLENGRRTGPGSDGQVCMSHPEVRKFFAAKLREYIKQDRDKIVQAKSGEPYPTLYSLVPNDNTNKCVCPECTARAKKYGAYTGVVLEFINAVAEDIARDYPDIQIVAGAYTFYVDIPRGIRPRDNVIIYLAQLGSEFNSLPKRDTLRSMTHPINQKPRKVLEDWGAISKMLGTHDYWTAWSQPFQWPQANIHGLAQTLKLYYRCGMRHFFVEDELFGSRVHNFVDLQFYMAARLLQDPGQDEEKLIAEFMDLYYGPAALPMKRLLAYIERRQEEEPGTLASVPPAARKYFDRAFFIETDAMISEAEKAVANAPKQLANIRQERLALDETMLYLWESLNSPKPLPFKRDELLGRLKQNYEAAYRKYGGWGETFKKDDDARLEYLRNMPPIPPQFKGKKIVDVCGPQLYLVNQGFSKVVADPDAAVGKACRLDSSAPGSAGKHDGPPTFGLYDNESKERIDQVIPKNKVPRDEKYHLYFAGRMKGSASMYLWAHASWRLSQRLHMAYNSALPNQKMYDVYVSIKLEGPAYVPGSAKENSFSIDRIVLVEAAE
jgi:hypothetical protein